MAVHKHEARARPPRALPCQTALSTPLGWSPVFLCFPRSRHCERSFVLVRDHQTQFRDRYNGGPEPPVRRSLHDEGCVKWTGLTHRNQDTLEISGDALTGATLDVLLFDHLRPSLHLRLEQRPTSAGEPLAGSAPSTFSRFAPPADRAIRFASLLTLSTIAPGIFAGATSRTTRELVARTPTRRSSAGRRRPRSPRFPI